jgi:molecular chaperone DnaK
MDILGIDLGTTNSVVWTYERGQFRVVPIHGRRVTPSAVGWDPRTSEMHVGAPARQRALLYPETTVLSNKRHMGDREKRYEILGKRYTPVDIAAFLLRHLVDGSAATLGRPVRRAVITVPAYFDGAQREDTLRAAEQAGLEVLQLQAEPTAAAIAYGLNRDRDQTLVVYDLGGGTFDVSVLEVRGNEFTVRAVGGDRRLGGDDLDQAVVEHLYRYIRAGWGVDLEKEEGTEARVARQRLKELAEQAKTELSSTQRAELRYPQFLTGTDLDCVLTRAEFEGLVAPLLDRTVEILRDTLRQAGVAPDEVHRVICVGGSTKSPLVRERIARALRQPYMADNVDEVVAHGAAVTAVSLLRPGDGRPDPRAEILPEFRATNVTPFKLGIRLKDDRFGVLVEKNVRIPASAEDEFTTDVDWATETEVVVFQGEADRCSDNVQLGGFRLTGIRKARAGVPRIRVRFALDDSGILRVDARDDASGTAGDVEIVRFAARPYEPVQPRVSPESLNIGVSKVHNDNIGAVLTQLGFAWTELDDAAFSTPTRVEPFHLLFINCATGGDAARNAPVLREFVARGGVLYVSDLSAPQIEQAFPGRMRFGTGGLAPQTVDARIVSPQLREALGRDRVPIHFDMMAWRPISTVDAAVDVMIRGEARGMTLKRTDHALMAGFAHGEGYVVYTSFHNHAQSSEEERALLRLIALKPIAARTGSSLVELAAARAG